MVRRLILETTFLIDLERERRRSEVGPAMRFLERHAEASLYLTFTTAGELSAGVSLDEQAVWEAFIAPFQVLPADRDTCWKYGDVYRYLRKNGLLIGANDLWIAATAVAHGLPLVTRNVDHFDRVPGLEVLRYQ